MVSRSLFERTSKNHEVILPVFIHLPRTASELRHINEIGDHVGF